MRNSLVIKLILTTWVLALGTISTVSNSSSVATRQVIPVGMPVKTTIHVFGTGASEYGIEEPYDVKITVLKILRGTQAWEMIQDAEVSNKPPSKGFDYILALVGFEYDAKSMPGNKPFIIKQDDFKAYSMDNRTYQSPFVSLPAPPLIGKVLRPGDSHEGWVAFSVAQEDEEPLMFFRGGIWFKLF
ncbi:MAG: hypothetical protein JW932_07520 [Deltaproteobacteria bacterium]|nr:hypothetical protein [Deltaproteobacteria bacterium]